MMQADSRWLSRLPDVGGYGVAVLSVLVAATLIITWRSPMENAPASLLICAVTLSAWRGGLRAGLLALVLALIALDCYVTAPDHSLAAQTASMPRLLVFALAALFVCLLGASQKRAAQSLSNARDELAGKVVELQNANQALQAENAERQRAEGLVRESEQRFRALIERSSDAAIMFDSGGTILYASPPIERLVGYAPEEMVGQNRMAFIDPHQHDAASAGFAHLLHEPGKFGSVQRRVRHRDGSWRWLEATASNWLHEPAVRAVVANLRDITERKQAEDALRESEQRFRDHAETVTDFLWETGPDHRFLRGSERFSGLDQSWPQGMRRWDLATDVEEEPEKWRRHIETLEARQAFRDFRYRTTRGNGSPLYIATSGKPVFDPDGHFLGYRGGATDVTAAVHAAQTEEALQNVRAALAHATRVTTLGELTASIAHEINQPLAAVVTNASASRRWLAAQPPDLDEAREALDRIVREGNRASDIINRIRALLKKSAGPMQRLDINETILEVIALTKSELQMSQVALTLQLADDLPQVIGDRVQLQQVILNLIVNAVEAMRGQSTGRRELLVGSRRDAANGVLVTVEDSGPGLDPASVSRLFDAFYTTKQDGMGMGLAISRSIIEAHDGRLWASPNTPKGAVFHFSMPAEDSEEAMSDPTDARGPARHDFLRARPVPGYYR